MHNNPPTSAAAEEVYIDSSGRIAHGGTRPPLAFSPPFSPPLDRDAARREDEEAIAKAKEYAASYRASDLLLSPRRPTPPSDDEGHDQQQAERDPSTTTATTGGRRLLRRRRLWNSGPPPANFDAASMPPLPGVERSFTSAFDVVVNWRKGSSTPVRGRIPQHEKDDDRLQQHEDHPEQDTHPQDPRLDLNVDVVPAAGSSSVSTPTCASPAWETLSDDAYRLTDRQRRKVWEIVEEEAEDRRVSETVARRSWRVALFAAAVLPLLLPLSRGGFPGRAPWHNPQVAHPHPRFVSGPAFVRDVAAQASTRADEDLLRETASLLARQRRRRNDEEDHAKNAAVSDTDRERARAIARGEAADRLADLVSRVEA